MDGFYRTFLCTKRRPRALQHRPEALTMISSRLCIIKKRTPGTGRRNTSKMHMFFRSSLASAAALRRGRDANPLWLIQHTSGGEKGGAPRKNSSGARLQCELVASNQVLQTPCGCRQSRSSTGARCCWHSFCSHGSRRGWVVLSALNELRLQELA